MMSLEAILERAKANRHALSRDELAYLLSLTNPADLKKFHEAAYEVKCRHAGKIRGQASENGNE